MSETVKHKGLGCWACSKQYNCLHESTNRYDDVGCKDYNQSEKLTALLKSRDFTAWQDKYEELSRRHNILEESNFNLLERMGELDKMKAIINSQMKYISALKTLLKLILEGEGY